MKKIGVAIKAMVSGNSPGVTINRGEWSRKIGDIRQILRHVPSMESDHQLYTTYFFFDEEGCYVVVARTMLNRNFDNIAGWIYLPADAAISGADVKETIGIVKNLISKSELPTYEQLEEHFGRRFFEERDPIAQIASPRNGMFAMRNLTAHSLEEILGENRYQEYYADYEATFIEESPGEINGATDISDLPIEAPELPEPEPEPESEPVAEPISPYAPLAAPVSATETPEETPTSSSDQTPEETHSIATDEEQDEEQELQSSAPLQMQEAPEEYEQSAYQEYPEEFNSLPEEGKKRYGAILTIVTIAGVLLTMGVWGIMIERHAAITQRRDHDIQAYHDSIYMLTQREIVRKDSIEDAAVFEAREGMPQAQDFISMRTKPVDVYSDYEGWVSVTTKVPEYNMDAPEQLERRGYRLIHSRRSQEEGEGGFYPAHYRMYEKLIRGTGYVRVLIHEGPCDEVVIYFPNAEATEQFLSQISSLGYVRRNDGYGYIEYKVPVRYSVYGSSRTDYDALHETGEMIVYRNSDASNEITINTSGCI